MDSTLDWDPSTQELHRMTTAKRFQPRASGSVEIISAFAFWQTDPWPSRLCPTHSGACRPRCSFLDTATAVALHQAEQVGKSALSRLLNEYLWDMARGWTILHCALCKWRRSQSLCSVYHLFSKWCISSDRSKFAVLSKLRDPRVGPASGHKPSIIATTRMIGIPTL